VGVFFLPRPHWLRMADVSSLGTCVPSRSTFSLSQGSGVGTDGQCRSG
jgi:hypothetical protein